VSGERCKKEACSAQLDHLSCGWQHRVIRGRSKFNR